MGIESLNFWLTKFIQEVCKKDGKRYPARTLYSIACEIQRHIQETNVQLVLLAVKKYGKKIISIFNQDYTFCKYISVLLLFLD